MATALVSAAPEVNGHDVASPVPLARPSAVARAVGLGFGVTLLQVLLAVCLSGRSEFRAGYATLFAWDSGFYCSFVEHGYYSPPNMTRGNHGNVSFFPAYPLAASLLVRATGGTARVCLLVTAQLAAWGFWTYLFLLFRRWGASPGLTVLGTLLIACHPAAFFLVAGYTESLFLFALLGLIYWTEKDSSRGLRQSALHGFVMTATRLVGAPVAAYPLLHRWFNAPRPGAAESRAHWLRRFLPALVVSGIAGLGAGLFFVYCHVRFGQWNLFSKSQYVGWGASANYFAFFSWRTYCPQPPFLREGFFNPIWLNQVFVPFTVLLFAALLVLEYRQRRTDSAHGWGPRGACYACAALMLFVVVCGNASTGMYSMVRYLLPIDILLTLAVIHWLTQMRAAGRKPWHGVVAGGWLGLSFLIQIWLTYRFTHGQWVA